MDDKVLDLLFKIQESQGRTETTLAEQAVVLKEHVRRTTAVEERQEKFEAALVPLRAHVAFWGFLGKVLAVLATAAGVALTVKQLLGK